MSKQPDVSERIRRAIYLVVVEMHQMLDGDCIRPDRISQGGECADGNCWCNRFLDRAAADVIEAIPAPKIPDLPQCGSFDR